MDQPEPVRAVSHSVIPQCCRLVGEEYRDAGGATAKSISWSSPFLLRKPSPSLHTSQASLGFFFGGGGVWSKFPRIQHFGELIYPGEPLWTCVDTLGIYEHWLSWLWLWLLQPCHTGSLYWTNRRELLCRLGLDSCSTPFWMSYPEQFISPLHPQFSHL